MKHLKFALHNEGENEGQGEGGNEGGGQEQGGGVEQRCNQHGSEGEEEFH
jgi:hypothetical protein